MRTDEHDRHELFRAFEQVFGAQPARTLIEPLPPRPWEQLATRDDLSNGLQLLEHRLDAEFRAQIIAPNRLLLFSMIGAMSTAASLAFAAVRV